MSNRFERGFMFLSVLVSIAVGMLLAPFVFSRSKLPVSKFIVPMHSSVERPDPTRPVPRELKEGETVEGEEYVVCIEGTILVTVSRPEAPLERTCMKILPIEEDDLIQTQDQ